MQSVQLKENRKNMYIKGIFMAGSGVKTLKFFEYFT